MSDQNWQLKESGPFAPNCGACPGDGSICPSSCKVAEESPPVPQDIKSLLKLMAYRTHTTGPKTLAAHLIGAADYIEALERQLAEVSKDVARFRWVLPILTGDTDHTGDLRAIQLGFELARGSSGADAIDAAMKEQA